MANYWLIRLGRGNKFAGDALKDGYIGVNFLNDIDLSADSFLGFREFQRKYIPILMKNDSEHPSKISAGLASGNTWQTIAGVKIGDKVLMPTGNGDFQVGEIISGYEYCPVDSGASHRRKVKWLGGISKDNMSESLCASSNSRMTIIQLTGHSNEIERLISGESKVDSNIENIADFGLESHLEEFLVYNWNKSTLGKDYDIFTENGEVLGQQYVTDAGRIDILALSKDKKTWLIIELKKGHSSDSVVGQIARYIGYAKENIAGDGQKVKGIIISGSDDKNIRYAISTMENVDFMTYEVSFKLEPVNI